MSRPSPRLDGIDDVLVPAKVVRARFGGIADMTLWRWMHNDRLGFPEPVVINRRRYWRLNELTAFEARQSRRRCATLDLIDLLDTPTAKRGG